MWWFSYTFAIRHYPALVCILRVLVFTRTNYLGMGVVLVDVSNNLSSPSQIEFRYLQVS